MSISFNTQIENHSNGDTTYRLQLETDVKRYFTALQDLARNFVDESMGIRDQKITEDDMVTPVIDSSKPRKGFPSKVDYVCSWCERSIISGRNRYFVHCPYCGKKIDYSNHEFLRSGMDE